MHKYNKLQKVEKWKYIYTMAHHSSGNIGSPLAWKAGIPGSIPFPKSFFFPPYRVGMYMSMFLLISHLHAQ